MVILVNENDEQIGTMEKLEAHEKALLHRAFSVFIFNAKGEVLMQQRALTKYHSAGLWTNSCCSHPFPDETTYAAANRRLEEEMGLSTDLQFIFKFRYIAPFENKLTEHEIDHVFVGKTDNLPTINMEEVHAFKYMHLEEIKEDITTNPEKYTAWFKIIFEKFTLELTNNRKTLLK